MAWEDHIRPHWFDEMPFFVAAALGYAALFALNPQIRFGSREREPDRAVPIEFVAQLPVPSPNLAPALGGGDDQTPRLGPGAFEPEKARAGAPDAPPKAHPSPKPAKPKPHPHPKRVTIAKAAAPAPAVHHRPAPDPAAVAAAREAARVKAQRVAAARREADAEKAAARAEARREAAAQKAAALEAKRKAAQEKALAAKAAAERRAAAERERRRQLAEARAAEAKRKAALAQQLATMSDPDEALDASETSGAAASSTGKKVSSAKSAATATSAAAAADDGGGDAGGAGGGALAGASKASAAAALADTADVADPGDAAGEGGADLLDAAARGGGSGPDGSGVSWTMEGPVGSRRVLKRAAPTSPDWVGARGLDLTVTVRFQVLPDGTVKAGSVIQKTSGFPEIDKRALDALKSWRFEAADGAPETWGRVTFRFTSA